MDSSGSNSTFFDDLTNSSSSSSSTPPSIASPRTDFSEQDFTGMVTYADSPPEFALTVNDYDGSADANTKPAPFDFNFGSPDEQGATISMDTNPDSHTFWQQGSSSSSTDSLPSQGSFFSDLQSAHMKIQGIAAQPSPGSELFYGGAAAQHSHLSHGWVTYPESDERMMPATSATMSFPDVGAAAAAQQDSDAMLRRGSYPFVRSDGIEMHSYEHAAYEHAAPEPLYAESMPLSADPSALHGGLHRRLSPDDYDTSSVRSGSEDFDDAVKEEKNSPRLAFSRPSSSAGHGHGHGHGHIAPPSLIIRPQDTRVTHTDDAASKETQYLRRRCNNCHTTEPPSWRRSTLNPGKIVCNKCGLYERTHARPRPHRFDELRTGTKVRKTTKILTVLSSSSSSMVHAASPAQRSSQRFRPNGQAGKNESHAAVGNGSSKLRRGSVASMDSSSGACSDADDSQYSSGPGSAFGSPASQHSFPSRPSSSLSQQQQDADRPIRVPQMPLVGAKKSATLPSAAPIPPSAAYYARRGSLPVLAAASASLLSPGNEGRRHSIALQSIPEVTGWHPVSMPERK